MKDYINYKEFEKSISKISLFIELMRTSGYLGNSPQKEEDLLKIEKYREYLYEIRKSVQDYYQKNKALVKETKSQKKVGKTIRIEKDLKR